MTTRLFDGPAKGLPQCPIRAELYHHQSPNAQRLIVSVDLSRTYFDFEHDEWVTSHCYISPAQVDLAIAALQRIQERLLTLGNESQASHDRASLSLHT
jgi:hypothetical protein